MVTAVYPGTFDPMTLGHEDLVRRGCGMFDELVIGVATSRSKGTLFTLDERIAIARECVAGLGNVRVEGFSGLLVEFARRTGATVLLRGVRSVTDFDYERQMAGMNQQLAPQVHTVFLTPVDALQSISGTLVREIAMMGGDARRFVSPAVHERLVARRDQRQAAS